MAPRGFFLQSDTFHGADFYAGDEADRIREWLAKDARHRPSANATVVDGAETR
jgi:hypothetical protein